MLSVPKMNFEHLFFLTDCTGIIQHCTYCMPDLENGYTTDDNARALILAAMLYNKTSDKRFVSLIKRYLSFLYYGQNDHGRWKNFMNYQRQFIEEEGSEDSFGRSLWGLGYMYSTPNLPKGIYELSDLMFKRALPNIDSIKAYRAQAYSILGLCNMYEGHDKIACKNIIENLAGKLIKLYSSNKTSKWFWFEDELTYANGIMPYALLKAYEITKSEVCYNAAIEILEFLDSIVMRDGYLKLIGCKGWAKKGSAPAEFDEQPVDTADMVLAYSEAYKVTGKSIYLEKAKTSFNWFLGLNCHNIPMINPDNGACFDGLLSNGINMNQGAESLFAYMLSYLTAEQLGIINLLESSDKAESAEFEEAV